MTVARPGLLRQPVAQAACRIALTHLDAAHAAHARLKDGKDAEALHDFRVALRRTRSVLRAYRPWLGRIPRKLRRRLRALARATNVARDTEVMMDWLRAERRKIREPHRAGFIWLQALLGERYEASCAEITREVLKEFAGIEQRLRALLAPIANADQEAASSPSYRVITADLIRQHAAELAEHLEDIDSVDDAGAIHAARIRGKRLRYLIEPLANELPAAAKIVVSMKRFQDRFGVLCDAFVQAREIASAVETAGAGVARDKLEHALGMAGAGAPTRDVLPGLIALARRLRTETGRRYALVERHYLGNRVGRFLDPFGPFADVVAGRDPNPGAGATRARR
jgi:CHAD domain-containing protein